MRRILRKEILHCGCTRYVYDCAVDVLCCRQHRDLLEAGDDATSLMQELYDSPAYVAPPRSNPDTIVIPLMGITIVCILLVFVISYSRRRDKTFVQVESPHMEASWSTPSSTVTPALDRDIRHPFGLKQEELLYNPDRSW